MSNLSMLWQLFLLALLLFMPIGVLKDKEE
jgi:hypothetical protein